MARFALVALLLGMLALPAAAQRSKTFHLTPGSSLKVLLQENVTTGYSWALSGDSGARPLSLVGEDRVKPASGKVGSPGFRVFSFQAAKEGRGRLVFEYRRPWEKKASPARTFEVEIEVAKQTSATEVLGVAAYVQPGCEFSVSVPSNPSTGFTWKNPSILYTRVLKYIGRKDNPPPPGGKVGTPTTADFAFEALEQGQTDVTIDQVPPGRQETQAARTCFVRVTVER